MSLSRRDFLRLVGLVTAAGVLPGCSPLLTQLAHSPEPISGWPLREEKDAFRILSRLTFGPRVQDRQQATRIGTTAWIEEQLAPEEIDDQGADLRVRSIDVLEQEANVLASLEKRDLVRQLKQATILRQVYSQRQLFETMVEFWTDHFNISVNKGDCWFLKVVDDREVIRKNALGSFRDLLWASCHSPAMLVYLDNQANHRDAPNENYARELMELHTLGIDGGYRQRDVMELARGLTGWTVKQHFWQGEFTFDPEAHDDRAKTVLGNTFSAGGQYDAEQMIDRLASHPSTARFIATKLVRRFITDHPERDAHELVKRTSQIFLKTRGDIRAMLRTILLDGIPDRLQPKFKRPVHFVASALRMLQAETDGGRPILEYLGLMGQPTFEWPTPDGPPENSETWQNNLMPRSKLALNLAMNQLPGTHLELRRLFQNVSSKSPEAFLDTMGLVLNSKPLPPEGARAILETLDDAGLQNETEWMAVITAGLIASPAFQWR